MYFQAQFAYNDTIVIIGPIKWRQYSNITIAIINSNKQNCLPLNDFFIVCF